MEQGRGVGSLARGQFERQVDTMGAGNGVSRLLGMLSWITNFLGCMLLEGGKCFAVKMHFGQRKDNFRFNMFGSLKRENTSTNTPSQICIWIVTQSVWAFIGCQLIQEYVQYSLMWGR